MNVGDIVREFLLIALSGKARRTCGIVGAGFDCKFRGAGSNHILRSWRSVDNAQKCMQTGGKVGLPNGEYSNKAFGGSAKNVLYIILYIRNKHFILSDLTKMRAQKQRLFPLTRSVNEVDIMSVTAFA